MPRWKDNDERGAFGAWLSDQVGEKTFDWLAAEMAQRGHVHGADYYRAMASGAKPPGRVIGRALREFFGAPPEAPSQTPGAGGEVSALVGAIGELVAELRAERVVRAAERPAPYDTDVDAKTRRRRRAYWIDQAVRESRLTRPGLRAAVGLPAGREATLRRWLEGELPKGGELERLARAIMLPMEVLKEPPATDLERLVGWRREAVGEVPELEAEPEPARKRRTA